MYVTIQENILSRKNLIKPLFAFFHRSLHEYIVEKMLTSCRALAENVVDATCAHHYMTFTKNLHLNNLRNIQHHPLVLHQKLMPQLSTSNLSLGNEH